MRLSKSVRATTRASSSPRHCAISQPWTPCHAGGRDHTTTEMAENTTRNVVFIEKTIAIPTALELQQSLAKYGYQIDLTGNFDEQTQIVLDAFRKHFCVDLIKKEIDLKSYATLLALIKKYKS